MPHRRQVDLCEPRRRDVFSMCPRLATPGSLFERAADASPELTPLAERLRPRTLAEVVGQEHLLGEGAFLSEVVRSKKLPSIILWGPPGTGKTTIARLLADAVGAAFEPVSAVTSGVKELRAALESADARRAMERKRTVLFIDEIHRFNKAQQDALLPHTERGAAVLVGATTENPSFEVNAALLSRCKVLVLRPLEEEALLKLLGRALSDEQRGLGFHWPAWGGAGQSAARHRAARARRCSARAKYARGGARVDAVADCAA